MSAHVYRDFFGAEALRVFDECWKPVLSMVHHELDGQLAQCFDVIAVLVMTRIVGHAQLQLAHARVPVLEGFLDSLGLMLWPHFSRLIREHIGAVTVGALLPLLEQTQLLLLVLQGQAAVQLTLSWTNVCVPALARD